ncbi:S41 family peptidase [Candidatus Izemoplasma sp. B36]|uniref:S41 family peptidase n=1 Tax=Candidatus Izemoplasma sp. B36 TaxID=3242468 RepID=UPI0035581653
MKKLLSFVTLLLFVFVLVGCGDTTTAVTTAAPTTEAPTTTEEPTTLAPTTVDTTAPVFSGVVDIDYYIDDPAPNYMDGVTATDDVDGDITDQISVDASSVDLEVAGEYTITYSVTDTAGNPATETALVTVSIKPLTNEEKLALDLAAIDFEDGIDFPIFGANFTRFTYSSSNPEVVTNDGAVIRPGVGEDDVVVDITITGTLGSATDSKVLTYTVQAQPEVAVTSSVLLPFESLSEEYTVDPIAEVEVYYVNDGTLPYIDVETFINICQGVIDAEQLVYTPIGNDVLEVSYEVTYEDFDGQMVTELLKATIDFTANTFTVESFDFFDNYSMPTESDYGEGLIYADYDFIPGSQVVIPLGEYNFDIITHTEGENTYYLMPLHVTNLLFNSSQYYSVYYNGDKLWGVDFFSDEDLPAQTRTSSYNALNMEQDMKDATYHFLALTLDYFYGLKDYKQIESGYDYLLPYSKDILAKSDGALYESIFTLTYDLDDLHSSHSYSGYYSDLSFNDSLTLSLSDLGPDTISFYNGMWRIEDKLEALYGSTTSVPQVRYLDDNVTAVIYIRGFDIDTPNVVNMALGNLPANIENVVIDLTYNTGGNVGAVFRTFGYMTEESVIYNSQNATDGSTVSYYIQSEYVAYDYNWFIASSSVTFSAANLMVSMAKQTGVATIIGQQSGGGECSITPIYTPDGSMIVISSLNSLKYRTGNEVDGYEYLHTEGGIEVDYYMEDPTSDSEMAAVIAQALLDQQSE